MTEYPFLEGDGAWCLHGVPEDEPCSRCADDHRERDERRSLRKGTPFARYGAGVGTVRAQRSAPTIPPEKALLTRHDPGGDAYPVGSGEGATTGPLGDPGAAGVDSP